MRCSEGAGRFRMVDLTAEKGVPIICKPAKAVAIPAHSTQPQRPPMLHIIPGEKFALFLLVTPHGTVMESVPLSRFELALTQFGALASFGPPVTAEVEESL